jgi:hypothetical protein
VSILFSFLILTAFSFPYKCFLYPFTIPCIFQIICSW